MIKIDFHIHTVYTQSDPAFEYSFDTLKRYVLTSDLDCIAITNHNIFDRLQYEEIRSGLSIKVFPGIEVDLEGGHILVIANDNDVEDFSAKCDQVRLLIRYPSPSITIAEFRDIFKDLSKYILIPHYDKSPKIPLNIIKGLDGITCGEVQSAKKFIQKYNDSDSLVPVLFSDQRMRDSLESFESKCTFINIESKEFSDIKRGLTKKDYVSLTRSEGNKFFEIADTGIKLSTGLNVILGKRSSGKSFTLEQIAANCGEDDVKYIKQFELLERNDERDQKEFDQTVSRNQSDYTERFLSQFKIVVDDVRSVNIKSDEKDLENYLSSLMDNANNQARQDIYSKTVMFSEHEYQLKQLKTLEELISSVEVLLENTQYTDIIEKSVTRDSLKSLYTDLVCKYKSDVLSNRKKQYVNSVVAKIQEELNYKASLKVVENIDFRKIALNRSKAEKFKFLVESLKQEKEIGRKDLFGYSVVAERGKFSGASELKKVWTQKPSLVSAYNSYNEPFEYMNKLSEAGVDDVDIYKLFTKVTYKILNKYGTPVSGGERSEYRLLKNLHDAKDFDILLIDEPESSFDNVFLFESVNKKIKDLSKNMPVVVVTHNSTVGASISPDYLIYTSKTFENGELIHDVYYGHPTSKYLETNCGKKIENYQIQINSLEAGVEPYSVRGKDYENLKN
ncbi:hypothetical protein [Vibrio alginolyticus]